MTWETFVTIGVCIYAVGIVALFLLLVLRIPEYFANKKDDDK